MDIVHLMTDLKKRSIESNFNYLMHLDKDTRKIWVTHEGMDDQTKNQAKEKTIQISDKIIILNVEFPGIQETGNHEYKICFKKQGYSDSALIHIIDNKKKITLKIEPFLSEVQVINNFIYHKKCK